MNQRAARGSRGASGRERAFTLVEILVASCVMMVALTAIYQVWHWLSSSAATEIWATDQQKKLATFDSRIRESVARGGYPTLMTTQGLFRPDWTDAGGVPKYIVQVSQNSGTETDAAGLNWRVFDAKGDEGKGTAGTKFLSFYKVEPGFFGVEGKPNKSVGRTWLVLMLSNGHKVLDTKAPLADLCMGEVRCDPSLPGSVSDDMAAWAKANLNNPPAPAPSTVMTLVTDVSRVRVSARGKVGTAEAELGTTASTDSQSVLRIEVECLESRAGRRRVFKRFEGENHLGVNMGGTVP